MQAPSTGVDPGSFRDPDSRVFRHDGEILRALSATGLADFEALESSELFERLQADGRLVRTERLDGADAPSGVLAGETAAVLRHEPIPFVSYPYEWSFSMLQDAALLQLDLLLEAIDAGLMLKDSTPYNVQFRGGRPVFIDVGSFERLREGEPWIGYRQFCMLYLYPLMIQAYAGLPFQPLLRGAIDGITPEQARAMLAGERFKRGLMTHVKLHARMEARERERERDVKSELRKAGFSVELIKANVRKLRKLVAGLRWQEGFAQFSDYTETNTYESRQAAAKEAFVREAIGAERPALVWDLGCNDGRYSRAAIDAGAGYCVALDAEQLLAERLYRRFREEREERILPLTMNLADASPGLGWRGRERLRMEERGRPGAVLALALLHHVVITANVPLREALGWLADLGATLVVEFVDRDDAMTQRLLSRKQPDANPDYTREWFERLLAGRCEVERHIDVTPTRRLYLARPR